MVKEAVYNNVHTYMYVYRRAWLFAKASSKIYTVEWFNFLGSWMISKNMASP